MKRIIAGLVFFYSGTKLGSYFILKQVICIAKILITILIRKKRFKYGIIMFKLLVNNVKKTLEIISTVKPRYTEVSGEASTIRYNETFGIAR